MKQVHYTRTEPWESEEVKSPLWAFVYDIPYLACCDVFPPLHILNQVLETGGSDGGMGPGCTWESFRLSEEEYAEMLPVVLHPNREELEGFARYAGQQMLIDHEFDHLATRDAWLDAVAEKHRDSYRKRIGG